MKQDSAVFVAKTSWIEDVLKSSPIGVFMITRTYNVVFWNDVMVDYTGVRRDDIVGRDLRERFPRFGESKYADRIGNLFDLGIPVYISERNASDLIFERDGALSGASRPLMTARRAKCESEEGCAVVWVQDYSTPVATIDDLHAEINARKEAETRIREERERSQLLYREIFHRAKNDLSLVMSLISIRRNHCTTGSPADALDDIEARIAAIASTYDQLYLQGEDAIVDLRKLVHDLADRTVPGNRGGLPPAECVVDVPTIRLHIDKAVPLGLMLNEILTNVVQHAFPAVRRPYCSIIAEANGGTLRISIRDNGPGLPDDAIRNASGGNGLALVRALAQQLRGTLNVQREDGSVFTIEVPLVSDPHEK